MEVSNAAKTLRILLLEDSPLDAELIVARLTDGGLACQFARVDTRDDFVSALEQDGLDLILADYSLPSFDGVSALEIARQQCPQVPFIFVSGAIGEELAIETLKRGATDYVLKQRLGRLVPSVRRALNEAAERAERKRLERELRQHVEQLAEADRRKDQFLTTLAHELRNPLAAIVYAVNCMHLVGLKDATLLRAKDLIELQGQHMSRMLEDLLDVSRISRGKLVLRSERLDLAAVVASAVESTRPLRESRGHDVSIAWPSEPLWVQADRTRLEQVFTNLVDNATKFSEPGGRIWLTVARQGEEAVIRVRDMGLGIAPEMLSRIFDMFVQAEGSPHKANGGLGLGLTLVRSLVELHGGSVAASSGGLGKGSEFLVCLPLATCCEAASQAATEPAPAVSRRVVLVEDDAVGREMLCDLLRLWGHRVETADDGAQGLEAILRCRPDVALIDIGLPGMDGYELARKLRREPGGGALYLIALTGYGQPEDRSRALGAGFDAHLVKPPKLEELCRLLADGT